jgi:hypothetical protein
LDAKKAGNIEDAPPFFVRLYIFLQLQINGKDFLYSRRDSFSPIHLVNEPPSRTNRHKYIQIIQKYIGNIQKCVGNVQMNNGNIIQKYIGNIIQKQNKSGWRARSVYIGNTKINICNTKDGQYKR